MPTVTLNLQQHPFRPAQPYLFEKHYNALSNLAFADDNQMAEI